MRRLCYLILLLLTAAIATQAQPGTRKKVAVVLSGGGAKGVAHIGALKVIEEAGIPIDYIVGTSMGSIIGGLYAIGYTPEQMDSLVSIQDWGFILSDAVNRGEELLIKKQRSEQYTLTVPFKNKPKDALKGGVIAGRNIARLFSELTVGYHDSIDFNRLPIPFACVAEDLVDGKEYVFHSGKLALAMRASMSIPGVFQPVKWNGMVLVDGGMCNNYPVDVAKEMGADIVIGVDVKEGLSSAEDLNTLSDIAGQIIDLMGVAKYNENVQNSDVHIHVNVKGYSSASFTPQAIQVLMERGELAARRNWESLIELKRRIGIAPNYVPKKHGPFATRQYKDLNDIEIVSEIDPGEIPENTISVGVHFDNESLASLILGTNVTLNKRKTHQASLTVRLGQQMGGRLDYTAHPFNPKWYVTFSYQLDDNDMDLYNNGDKFSTYSYIHHLAQINISRSWNSIHCSVGGRYEYFNYQNILVPSGFNDGDLDFRNQHLVVYYGRMLFDTYDRRTYPTKGCKWNLMAELYTDNGVRYAGKISPVISAFWEGAFKIRNRFTILPWIGGRAILNDEYSFAMTNMVGGNTPGRYVSQQLPFVGIDYMQLAGSKLFTGGVRFRQRMGSNHYVTLTGNTGVQHDEWKELFRHMMWGGGLTYGYDSFLGPIEITFNYSNITHKLGTYVRLGYEF